MVKLSPHPQLPFEFGLLKTNSDLHNRHSLRHVKISKPQLVKTVEFYACKSGRRCNPVCSTPGMLHSQSSNLFTIVLTGQLGHAWQVVQGCGWPTDG